jgi:hypothetical protein
MRNELSAIPRRLLLTSILGAVVLPGAVAQAAPCNATLKVPGHHPKAGTRWPVTVTCRRSGKAVRATATYQFLYNGQVVATRYPSPNADPDSKCSRAGTCRKSPWPFTGRFRDSTFTWPRRAVGFPLTFRVVVRVRGRGKVNLDYAVKVRA